jgi:hypothetical protein
LVIYLSTYPWYVAARVFEWLQAQGGLSVIAKINENKAKTLYGAIDASDFYSNPVVKKYRPQDPPSQRKLRNTLLVIYLSQQGQCYLMFVFYSLAIFPFKIHLTR